MRVIAGSAKGHLLKAPERPTRPATDLVRGAIFDILQNTAQGWERVLDLFSGSGALGIEALSRGAGWVDFVERAPKACAIIKQNLEKTKLADQAHVYCSNVTKALSFLEKAYDIILIDPPYTDTTIGRFIEEVATSRLVKDTTTVVVTHSPRLTLAERYGDFKMVKERRHGDSVISIYQKEVKI